MGLTLTVLGCSGSYPAPGVPCSGFLVQSETTSIVLDMGHGTLAELQRHLDVAELDAVVLTHSHADHWVDLTALRILTHYQLGRDHVPVWGTDETRHMVGTVCSGVEPAFAWNDLAARSEFEVGDLRLRVDRTDHYVETYAVRVTAPDGASIVYSADTGPGWSVEHLGRDVDLALVEASYATDEARGEVLHLTAAQAGAMARAARARRLVLTHLVPGADAGTHAVLAEGAYGGPVVVAAPGDVYRV